MPRSAQDAERIRERDARIVRSAREIAESEGWPAVTVRRLADAVGVSQPILYRHFPGGRDDIVARVVVDGYAELAEAMDVAADGADRLRALVSAYLDFARTHPAVYEAMASARSSVVFAAEETPAVLRRGFRLLEDAVGGADARERAVRAELLWSMLHGVSQLDAHGRLDAELDEVRGAAMVALFERRG
ncbi:regulatory protein, tetR family [Microbacterium azadirachtae]|uniref:Regulatory protein, tetR family n=1 Tax=Microbacterium azadirachtae TaxID=582680 RepID=A0A1I6FRK1_9MICO|nr:TetR/AcrR family transcriptional regulator [Microbacterium azadirachtae]SFR32534.1 regulatory protein, tetR family [Microbacterium azadirachtae]